MLVIVSACGTAPEPAPSEAGNPPPDARLVMQITQGWGCGGISNRGITELLLWDSGWVVFVCDGSFREAQLDASSTDSLVQAADVLYSLGDYVMALRGTDRASTLFTVETMPGQRTTVRVYGMILEGEWPADPKWYVERYADAVEKLKAFWTLVRDSLPEAAPIMEPDEVIVQFCCPYSEGAEPEGLPVWPSYLTGHLEGEYAKEAVRLGGLGPWSGCRLDGIAQLVQVVPVLPALHDTPYSS